MQLLGMDDFSDEDDFVRREYEIGSWLNVDDDLLQDDDFIGIERYKI